MGVLTDAVTRIRQACDEPTVDAKYSQADLLNYLRVSYQTVVQDINASSTAPIVVRHTLTTVANQKEYILPPNIGEILSVAKVNATTGLIEWEVHPRSHWNPAGHGFRIEGNIIRFLPTWAEVQTLQIEYVPAGDVLIHEGSCVSGDRSSTTLKFSSSPTVGTLDTRPNAYGGCMVRVTGSSTGYVEERIIESYANTTRVATLSVAHTSIQDGENVTYEVLPITCHLLEHVAILDAARTILAFQGNSKRRQLVNGEYAEKKRALRLYLVNLENRRGHRFQRDVRTNERYLPYQTTLGWN